MDNNASESPERDAASRRRSGRVVKAPSKFSPEPSAQQQAAKRKRDNGEDPGDDENDPPELDDESSEEDGDSDDETARAQRSRKSAQSKRPKKPTAKKAKTNGTAPTSANHTTSIPRRPKKSVRIDTGDKGTGLYAIIFGSGETSEVVAQRWLEEYRSDDGTALVILINCILQCIGCEHEVTVDDIRDPENIPNRLADLNTAYQEQQETEYPLISRTKNSRSFRDLLVGFFQTLVELLHESEVMYKDAELLDNLHAWLSSMSSSSLRPFRHTATTISLSVTTGLVRVADTLDDRITNVEQQLQASKRSKNKAKTSEIQRNLNEANDHRKICTDAIQSFFDTVFVHRYRDYDPKIRAECVEALGHWIWELPTVFREPGYLRYLGWMLSDTNPATRQEVLKQLLRIFKRDAEQLGHFIDRFRPRLVEIASQDAEVSVRVAAISVIDALRAAALLEPSEIDAIGELIFDNELRIRKAVVGFFVACVDDVFEGKVEQIGGADVLEEYDGVEEDDYESPRREWLDIKCLAETLAIYDSKIEERQQAGGSSSLDLAADILGGTTPETRISLASQVLYDKVTHLKRWQVLAGYLLHDHTTSTKRSQSRSKTKSAEANFKNTVVPSSDEESILLKVLVSAVKSSIAQTAELDRGKRKGQRVEANEAQEEIALELAGIIPQLLNKFGAEPGTATTVLQLEHVLSLDVFQQLRQDSNTYENLLDEIATQFNRHDDNSVISEAAAALLHARQHEELEEMADSKLSTLWENNLTALRTFDKTCELSSRGNLSASSLSSLKTVLMKISKLAGVSDCVDILDMEGDSPASSAPSIDILSSIVHRGKYEPQDDDIDDLEDEIVTYGIKTIQFYFMWRVRSLSKLLHDGTGVAGADLDRLSLLRQTYRRFLIETFSSRAAIDELRLFATGSLCDLHLTFATLRPFIERFRPSSSSASSSVDGLKILVQEIEPGLIPELIQIFDGAEKQFAKKTKRDKTLNGPAEDEDPVDDDEDDDDDDDEHLSKEERFAAELKAERALCEVTAKLVLSITARVLDNRGPEAGKLRRRLLRNQLKLGNNFKEVLNYLDEEKMLRRNKKPATTGQGGHKPALKQSVEEIMDDVYENSEQGDERRGDLEDDPIDDIDIDIDADDDDDEQPAGQNNDLDDDILGD